MKLIGLATIGRDGELRYTPQGDPVIGISLAYNYGKRDTGGNQPTQWVEASLWGKRAESLAPYLLKGKQFYVEVSDVHIETYEGKNGPGTKLSGRVAEIEFTRGGDRSDQQEQPARHHEDRKHPGAPMSTPARNSYADATGRAQPAQQAQGTGGLADMQDECPW